MITGILLQLTPVELQVLVSDKQTLRKALEQAALTLSASKQTKPHPPPLHISPAKSASAVQEQAASAALLAQDEKRTLFVGGLRFPHTVESITNYFSQYGSVQELNIPTDPQTKSRLGYAFVKFDSPSSVEAALRKSYHMINNVMVNVGGRGR